MGSNHFMFSRMFLLFYMFGISLCTTTFRHYRLDSPANRVASEGFVSFSGVSRGRCFAKCSAFAVCYYVSFDATQGRCILSTWNDGGGISAGGWSLYRLDPPGPDIGDYFTVGNHSLAVNSQKVDKTEAENLCTSSGFGRLVEIRSEQMFLDIANYLLNLSLSMRDLYGSMWIAGEYDGALYILPDGSPLPITTANDYDTDGNSDCLVMRKSVSYQYNDKKCDLLFSYMCERI